mmetsp:Transcript_14276/g.30766  ORF Transcript_14276/g.30766 Transcript_14276/m.30766 type:complete len:191 (-) Transcript_14276:137-709(-)|eukprot:CAMPEP_0185845028 /NCGR_PEP_ID=MMETSP1354-20130828/1094_1 /TAXON_ID=708628 /ORGANISM="Erythrolobus madagascarensis, Strain CCMP3276" /LENGTH=190 /DNA_ID=CAMNT_0028544877 /DNA_START=396 /DNA_END=968 /DNA_ORIENTATION=+
MSSAEEFVFFWKAEEDTVGVELHPNGVGVFSQWYMGSDGVFFVENVKYCCTEQYMMAEKAALFGDNATRDAILKSTSPKEMKALGRRVKPFDDKVWNENSLDIVVRGNVAKFGQNGALRKVLLSTGEKTIVEASPLDTIWGIGLGAPTEKNTRALNRSQWRGKNLLGIALERTRNELRSQESSDPTKTRS